MADGKLLEYDHCFTLGSDLQNRIVCGEILNSTPIALVQHFFFGFQLFIFTLPFSVLHQHHLLFQKGIACQYNGWKHSCEIDVSRRYTYDKVRAMIERQKERYGWEFIFLGANIDAAAEARRFGIDESMAANYHCDEVGTALNYEVISEAITSVRACATPLSADWKKKIDADYKKRGGKK